MLHSLSHYVKAFSDAELIQHYVLVGGSGFEGLLVLLGAFRKFVSCLRSPWNVLATTCMGRRWSPQVPAYFCQFLRYLKLPVVVDLQVKISKTSERL
jgi:hypothetical protein